MKIVLALGGNALGKTPEEQMELVKEAANSIADLVEQGHDVIVVHGNGPQVGVIKDAFDEASVGNKKIPAMPLAECVAMSQGYIGYHLQDVIKNMLSCRDIDNEVATIITQVVVDKDDDAFNNPTKPIGNFFTKDEAEILAREQKLTLVEDSGRGYRVVVPSPKPIDIVEKGVIKHLLEEQSIIIATGGGGIPVIWENNQYVGVQAVIDKDLAHAKLAMLIEADLFIILTAVNKVCINFGKSNQEEISKMSVEEAREYIEEGQFAPGSMLPKINSAIQFAEKVNCSHSVIASLQEAGLAVSGKAGTIIYDNH